MADGTGELQFIFRTRDVWEAMYRDCAAAEKSIDMEQYIFLNDEAGNRFLKLFADKARAGVKVRIVLDGVGSILLDKAPVEEIRKAGGIVHFYHRVRWKRLLAPLRLLPRTHVKTLVVDEKIAHTGSACIRGVMKDWHEMHVRFTGKPVEAVVAEQNRLWDSICNGAGRPHQPQGEKDLQYFVSEPHFGASFAYNEIIRRIKGAKKHIRIVTPYFMPPRRLRKALEKAKARGVRVDILKSDKTDVPVADAVARIYIPRLLQKGLNLYLFEDAVLHAKYVLVDHDWALIGSVNMDYLSLTRNREASFVLRERQDIETLWDKSEEYVQASRRVDFAYWREIPYLYKLAGRIGWYAREIL
jgi:cardiolipin synthase